MRRFDVLLPCLAALVVCACSGAPNDPGFGSGDDGGGGAGSGADAGSGGSGSGPGNLGNGVGDPGDGAALPDGSVVVSTTIYAHTDTEIYSMAAQSHALSLIGKVTGLGGGSGDTSITDLAVNGAGDVYVNSETVLYKAALPSGGSGTVALTQLATISAQQGQHFFALGFTPKDALGSGTGEVLVAGDGNGELWSVDAATGATKDLGNFGADPNNPGNTLGLSGDVVFYMDASGKPTGLATIRSCAISSKGSATCDGASDFLAGIDMTALAAAFGGGGPSTLNAGIYGSPGAGQMGPGIGYRDVFGLGAWGGDVYGFTREISGSSGSGSTPASLLSIATSGSAAGKGTVLPTQVSVTSGWSGAGVTSKVTVTVPPPPSPK
jgi:hypothetical protein